MATLLHRPAIRPWSWMMRTASVTFAVLLLWLPAIQTALAAETADKVVNIADTRGMNPGITKWIAGVYNSSYWEFGILSVVLMAAMGLILGYVCDFLMSLLGINLGKMQRHE